MIATLPQTTYPEKPPKDRIWRVLIVWHWNGFMIEDTDDPRALLGRMDLYKSHWVMQEQQGHEFPGTSRYTNIVGDILIVTRPGIDLD
jgi:hypothetical protein